MLRRSGETSQSPAEVARRKPGSHRRKKAVRELQAAHAHVRHQRQDFHHKLAHRLVQTFGLIAIEELNVKGLAAGMLAKSVHDAGWSGFFSKLTDKAESAGRRLVTVDPRGTSQRCSVCGYARDKDVMKLIDGVAGIYATDPNYARTLKARIREYGLLELVESAH